MAPAVRSCSLGAGVGQKAHLEKGGSCMPYASVIILKQIHKEAGASGLDECILILHNAAHQQQQQRHTQVFYARALAALEHQQ